MRKSLRSDKWENYFNDFSKSLHSSEISIQISFYIEIERRTRGQLDMYEYPRKERVLNTYYMYEIYIAVFRGKPI